MEKLAYLLLGVAAILWLGLIVKDSVEVLPWGLIGLLFIAGVGVLLVKVFKQRLNNSEDDYYSKKVDK
jgi:F0F1-type ATP synthase assembly protein I|tara:strand:+ start:443 stop:646 length:204 start_codon:yes stop_codon:yes gene_type:complete